MNKKEMKSKKVVIAAGGTGGHLYPGIALAIELRKRGVEPVFIVREKDMCTEILSRESFIFYQIPSMGMPRKLSLKIVDFFVKLVRGFFSVRKILKELKPDFVYGMGGYVSFPVIIMAWFSKIPSAIHEQNVVPGLTNKILAFFAKKITLSFPETKKYFPSEKVKITGTPIRPELFKTSRNEASKKFNLDSNLFTVLVFGGSQGAKNVNSVVSRSLELLKPEKEHIQFVHIAGKEGLEDLKKSYELNGIRAIVLPYLDSIGDAYAAADLVISRSGAMTVAEIKALGKKAVFIPFPYATDDHQYYNALALSSTGQAKTIRESDATPKIIAGEIIENLVAFKNGADKPVQPEKFAQVSLADIADSEK